MSDIYNKAARTFSDVLGDAALTVTIVIAALSGGPIHAQQPTYLVPVEMKDQLLRGSAGVAAHENEGMIGMNGKATAVGYAVESVMPGGPAAIAGILPGDVIVSLAGTSTKSLDASGVLRPIAAKKDGESLDVSLNRNGQSKTIALTVVARKAYLQMTLDGSKKSTRLQRSLSPFSAAAPKQWPCSHKPSNIRITRFCSSTFPTRMRLPFSWMT